MRKLAGVAINYPIVSAYAILIIKHINGTYGHDTGDNRPIAFYSFMKQAIRRTDCVGCWGGEEFLLVQTNTAGNPAKKTIDNLLHRLRTRDQIEADNAHKLSMSVGIAEARGELSIEELVKRADQALYT